MGFPPDFLIALAKGFMDAVPAAFEAACIASGDPEAETLPGFLRATASRFVEAPCFAVDSMQLEVQNWCAYVAGTALGFAIGALGRKLADPAFGALPEGPCDKRLYGLDSRVLKLSSRPLSLFIHLVDASYYALRGILEAHALAARCTGLKVPVVFFVLAGLGGVACAQSLLKVVPPVWMALTQEEKDSVQKRFLVEVAEPESFGIIIDTQGVNESTPGDNAGSSLGSAVASAAYIDRAINHRNYSAKSHLGVALLGGLLGSALDAKPVQQFHYRYAVKFLNGNIRYFDVVSDVLYFTEPSQGAGQWFYSSAKHGRQVFAFDRSGEGAIAKTQAFIDAVQAQAIRE